MASSSSEATESENSCTERYDYEKSPTTSATTGRRDGVDCGESENENTRKIADNLDEHKQQQQQQQQQQLLRDLDIDDLEYFNTRNDQVSLRHYRQRAERLTALDDERQQSRYAKRACARPASIKSAGSYEARDSGAVRDRNNGGQHEHYMVPTHEPNRPSDKRTLSLFNPDFLPNFNDMLMYVGRGDIENEREFYRSNIDDPSWITNGTSYVERAEMEYAKNSCARLDEIDDYSRSIEASYASLGMNERSSLQHLREQDCENIYAPVGLQAFQSQGRIDYNC